MDGGSNKDADDHVEPHLANNIPHRFDAEPDPLFPGLAVVGHGCLIDLHLPHPVFHMVFEFHAADGPTCHGGNEYPGDKVEGRDFPAQ